MQNDQPFQIANILHVKKRVDDLKYRSEDVKSRLAHTLKSLWNTERTLKSVNQNTDFSILRKNFPHFEEVIDMYESSVISLAKLEFPFEVQPILLQGDPGLGKTYFASELAKLIHLPFYEISLATTTSNFVLSGSNIQWAEGGTGFVSETLARGEFANPIILIDEIDKSFTSGRFSPLTPFYSLLETHTSKRFKDEALDIEMDASRIIWIATANYMNSIPEPIQSRMHVFKVQQPDRMQMYSVVENIYRNLIASKSYGKLLIRELDVDVIKKLTDLSPRSASLMIDAAAYKAIRDDRDFIKPTDIQLPRMETKRVGFI